MKKLEFVSIVVMMLLALCSCNKTEYQNVIPANATFVAKVDTKAIAEKGDLPNCNGI